MFFRGSTSTFPTPSLVRVFEAMIDTVPLVQAVHYSIRPLRPLPSRLSAVAYIENAAGQPWINISPSRTGSSIRATNPSIAVLASNFRLDLLRCDPDPESVGSSYRTVTFALSTSYAWPPFLVTCHTASCFIAIVSGESYILLRPVSPPSSLQNFLSLFLSFLFTLFTFPLQNKVYRRHLTPGPPPKSYRQDLISLLHS